LKKDLALPDNRADRLFTHRPLFDLRPDWGGSPAMEMR
jgi:hypothetical protein